MFTRVLNAFGIGGPSVDTVLDSPHGVPGQAITGQVRVQGGGSDAEIGQVVLSLVAGHERGGVTEFSRLVVRQGVRVPAGQLVAIPFQLPMPWETPITAVGGMPLPGMSVGVRTELVIASSRDKGDLDPVLVSPLPSQDKVLDAFGRLGFSFRGANVRAGRIAGPPQELGFVQELEFFPPAQYAGRINEVELTFVASSHDLYVELEGGRPAAGGDPLGQFRLSHDEALTTDWESAISGWLTQVTGGGHGNPAFSDQTGYHDQRRGPGMGGMLAAGAAGVVGGAVLGGVAADLFDGDEE